MEGGGQFPHELGQAGAIGRVVSFEVDIDSLISVCPNETKELRLDSAAASGAGQQGMQAGGVKLAAIGVLHDWDDGYAVAMRYGDGLVVVSRRQRANAWPAQILDYRNTRSFGVQLAPHGEKVRDIGRMIFER